MSTPKHDILMDMAKQLQAEMAEELHPDLVPYLEDFEPMQTTMLRHPLVYQVPLFSNGSANKVYEQKQRQLALALESRNFERYIFLHERPFRLQAFQELEQDGHINDIKYWSLLASIWIDTENAWANKSIWIELFNSDRPHKEFLMQQEDAGVYRMIEDEVTIYRGCQKGLNEDGLSWTLDLKKAKWFARRFQKGQGKVIKRIIKKSEIVAVLIGRGESEVIYQPN